MKDYLPFLLLFPSREEPTAIAGSGLPVLQSANQIGLPEDSSRCLPLGLSSSITLLGQYQTRSFKGPQLSSDQNLRERTNCPAIMSTINGVHTQVAELPIIDMSKSDHETGKKILDAFVSIALLTLP